MSFWKRNSTREATDKANWSLFFWTHDWRPVQFTLVVDNFWVKYVGEEHAIHLKNTIEENCTVTTEWDGQRYIGITLDWDYKIIQVHISMPNYVTKSLKQFKHKFQKNKYRPYPSAPIIYGSKNKYATPLSTAPFLEKKGKKFIHQVCEKIPITCQSSGQ